MKKLLLAGLIAGAGFAQDNNSVSCQVTILGSGPADVVQVDDGITSICDYKDRPTLKVKDILCIAIPESSRATTVWPIIHGADATSLLTAPLPCKGGERTSAINLSLLKGTPILTKGSTIDANIKTPGTATSIHIVFVFSQRAIPRP